MTEAERLAKKARSLLIPTREAGVLSPSRVAEAQATALVSIALSLAEMNESGVVTL